MKFPSILPTVYRFLLISCFINPFVLIFHTRSIRSWMPRMLLRSRVSSPSLPSSPRSRPSLSPTRYWLHLFWNQRWAGSFPLHIWYINSQQLLLRSTPPSSVVWSSSSVTRPLTCQSPPRSTSSTSCSTRPSKLLEPLLNNDHKGMVEIMDPKCWNAQDTKRPSLLYFSLLLSLQWPTSTLSQHTHHTQVRIRSDFCTSWSSKKTTRSKPFDIYTPLLLNTKIKNLLGYFLQGIGLFKISIFSRLGRGLLNYKSKGVPTIQHFDHCNSKTRGPRLLRLG